MRTAMSHTMAPACSRGHDTIWQGPEVKLIMYLDQGAAIVRVCGPSKQEGCMCGRACTDFDMWFRGKGWGGVWVCTALMAGQTQLAQDAHTIKTCS